MFGLFEKKSPYAATFGKGRVLMISGCKDEQTSGDALKIDKYFGLPDDVGAGGAGGACTNALMQILHRQEKPGVRMRDSLKCIHCLSCGGMHEGGFLRNSDALN